MNDFHSFLRFALPGISSVTELLILLSFSVNPEIFKEIYEKENLELPVAGLVALLTFFSIGLGFLYNLIYRNLPFMMVNYSGLVTHLKKKDYIRINFFDYLKNQSDLECINKQQAWGIINTLWHSRSGESKVIREATNRAEKFAHLLHNAATAFIGFIITSIFYIYLILNFNEHFNFTRIYVTLIVIALPLGIGHFIYFFRTLQDFRRFTEVILLADLKRKH